MKRFVVVSSNALIRHLTYLASAGFRTGSWALGSGDSQAQLAPPPEQRLGQHWADTATIVDL